MLKGGAKRPDILVIEPNVSPVAIETEVAPAATVESDALSRLGAQLRTTGRTILSSIAVRLPDRLRKLSSNKLAAALAAADDLEIAVFTGHSSTGAVRWPMSGWILGSLADLSILTQSASVPPEVIDAAAAELVAGVSEAAGLLGDVAGSHPGVLKTISTELRQEDSEQTRSMASTILANAFVFHETLAGGPGSLSKIKSQAQLRSPGGDLSKSAVLAEWRKILKINYWPIFDIARRILEVIPATHSKALIDRIVKTAERLLEHQLMRSHDLTGAVFQRLIVDRKFLAAYYTTPASAALLVGLALSEHHTPGNKSWRKAADVSSMRIADFACGTGTLLSTAYQRIGQLHELAGGDAEKLHPAMMADAIVGCDVLPAAAHLTASMLAGAHPTTNYSQSEILTVAYGKQDDGSVALGSLDLLDPQRDLAVLSITAKAAEASGEREQETWLSLPHKHFDLVLMNPPFTRATGHEGNKIGVPNPMFAAFASDDEEQRVMGAATKRLTEKTSAHGNAGEASIFLVLAHEKLKLDGIVGLVMPVSLLSGEAWEESRKLLTNNYSDLILASIAGADGGEVSFSADTDMGECLVVGRKTGKRSSRAQFVILDNKLRYPISGLIAARQVRRLIEGKSVRRLEDGPVGGTEVTFGDDRIGSVIDAPLPSEGGWNLSRIADLSLAQSSYQITNGKLWLPTMTRAKAAAIDITTVGSIGTIGPYHMDVQGRTAAGAPRGPFKIRAIKKGSSPTYPVLWSHDAEREKAMSFPAESEGIPLTGRNKDEEDFIQARTAEVWATASHCHFNRDFRFNSQSTSMQFTPKVAVGGRAWLSIKLASSKHEKAMVLWSNTTLGMLLYWWHANKQQPGRGTIGKSALDSLPILDVTRLSKSELIAAEEIFDAHCKDDLKPLHELADDPARAKLDQEFCEKVLGLEPGIVGNKGALALVREKLAAEPSIRGHKA